MTAMALCPLFLMRCMRLVRRRNFGVGLGMAEARLLDRVFRAGSAASTLAARDFARVLLAGVSCGTWANVVDLRRRFCIGGGATHIGVVTLGADCVSSVSVGARVGILLCGTIDCVIRLLVASFMLATLGTDAGTFMVCLVLACLVAVGAVASTSCWSSLVSCLALAFGIPLTILAKEEVMLELTFLVNLLSYFMSVTIILP